MKIEEICCEKIYPRDLSGQACHASNLLVLNSDCIVCAWFQGSREGTDDVAIWGAKRTRGKWNKPVLLAKDAAVPHWNPVLYRKLNGEVTLLYKVGRKISDWHTRKRTLCVADMTVGSSEELVCGDFGGRGPVRTKMIRLADGRLVAGASLEQQGSWTSFFDFSADDGMTWTRSSQISISQEIAVRNHFENLTSGKAGNAVSAQSLTGRGVIQPSLWQDSFGMLHAFLRSTEGYLYRVDIDVVKNEWKNLYRTDIPTNNSGIDTAVAKGCLFLCMNPISENWGARTPLVILASGDNGASWKTCITVENDSGEFSYPSLFSDGAYLYLSYTWNRVNIGFRKYQIFH